MRSLPIPHGSRAFPGCKVTLQSLPALEVFVLQNSCLHGKFCGPYHKLRLKHEGQRVIDVLRLQIRFAGTFKGLRIRTMTSHAVMQAGPARHEAFRLRVVCAEYKTHELVHQVAMKPGRPEGVIGNHPSRREYGKVAVRRSRNRRGGAQDRINRRIGMVKRDRVDAVESREIVLVRRVIPMPRNHIEGRMIDGRRPESPHEFRCDVKFAFTVFERSSRGLEVAGIRQSIRPNGTEFREAKRKAIILANIAARRIALLLFPTEHDAARNDANLAGRDVEDAKLRVKAQLPELRDNQHLSVSTVEKSVLHRSVDSIEMDRHANLHCGISITT